VIFQQTGINISTPNIEIHHKMFLLSIFVKTRAKLRYFIFISYKGTSYHGWQIQPNSVTVQKLLDEALTTILSENILTTGAGRTDTGVHATVFCAHFDSLSSDLEKLKNLVFKLNRYLPRDISVSALRKVKPDANARFSALSRTYKYFISMEKDPFSEDSSWCLHGNINVSTMNEASKLLLKHSDFTSFCRLHGNVKTNTCKIFNASWEKANNQLIFTIKADRFLRNMVRAIVGTMIEIGFGKMDLKEFEEIINAKDRGKAGKSAPAKGLFLTEIEYPDNIYI
jgi:tRNA pseudouridine38-40 synthase